jgi:hypothetical protein
MYKTIYIPVDNSDHSNTAVDIGVHMAKTFGSKIVGSHVYAAKMHDKRFKQMEAGLPEEYHDEKELDRQRQIHDSLITSTRNAMKPICRSNADRSRGGTGKSWPKTSIPTGTIWSLWERWVSAR